MRSAMAAVGIVVTLAVWSVARAAGPEQKSVDLLAPQTAAGEIPGWRSFHETPGTRTGDVWRLGADGVLVCKGQPLGYLLTEKDYTSFELSLEWRWPPGATPGKGGVLGRLTGPDKVWPKSLEFQLNAGQAGDFWGLDGYRLSGPAERLKVIEHPKFGRLTGLPRLSDAEKPAGQWNRYEIVVEGPTATLKINGQLVNRAEGCEGVPGKIALTAEGSEIHFRNVRIVSRP